MLLRNFARSLTHGHLFRPSASVRTFSNINLSAIKSVQQTVLNDYFGTKAFAVSQLLAGCSIHPLRNFSLESDYNQWLKSAMRPFANPLYLPSSDSHFNVSAHEIAMQLGLTRSVGEGLHKNYDLIIPDQVNIDRPDFLKSLFRYHLPGTIFLIGSIDRRKELETCIAHAREWQCFPHNAKSPRIKFDLDLVRFTEDVSFIEQQLLIADKIGESFKMHTENIALLLHQPNAFWLKRFFQHAFKYKLFVTIGDGVDERVTASECLSTVACHILCSYPKLQQEYVKRESMSGQLNFRR